MAATTCPNLATATRKLTATPYAVELHRELNRVRLRPSAHRRGRHIIGASTRGGRRSRDSLGNPSPQHRESTRGRPQWRETHRILMLMMYQGCVPSRLRKLGHCARPNLVSPTPRFLTRAAKPPGNLKARADAVTGPRAFMRYFGARGKGAMAGATCLEVENRERVDPSLLQELLAGNLRSHNRGVSCGGRCH